MIYLDNAATTLQKPAAVGNAVRRAIYGLASPGRGGHSFAKKGAETAFKTREAIGELFNVKEPDNIVFCMNATHALNIAIKALVKAGDRVVISGYEHNSVYRPLVAMGAEIAVAASPLFRPYQCIEAFNDAMTWDTSLVVVNQISNVFGYILPVDEIAELCKARGIPFIVDASQSAGHIDIDMVRLGAAFVAMSGHKGLYGPQGTGILIAGELDHLSIKTLMEGGSGSNSRGKTMPDFLPDRLEAGTHNMPGIAGLLEGVRFIKEKGQRKIFEHETRLVTYAGRLLAEIPGVSVYISDRPGCQSGVLSFLIDDMLCEVAAEELSKRGIAVRAGLHCAPLAHETAGTIETGTIRASFSAFNTRDEVRAFAAAVRDIIEKKKGRKEYQNKYNSINNAH
ncbi:MAG: aminotransferase class V-fold PLP-dependent enzyme [Clostridiales bacterium]|nr:aminotransferase class V-fold PLP-dependent enzyme [Clostridiales bacterium]